MKLFQKFDIYGSNFNQFHKDMLRGSCSTKWHDVCIHPTWPLKAHSQD